MITPLPDDAPHDVDALLRQRPQPLLPDDGFSARVLSALPPPRKMRWSEEQRRWTMCTAAGVGAVVLAVLNWRPEEATPRVQFLNEVAAARVLSALGRIDSPLWITVLVLGGTFAVLRLLEQPSRARRA